MFLISSEIYETLRQFLYLKEEYLVCFSRMNEFFLKNVVNEVAFILCLVFLQLQAYSSRQPRLLRSTYGYK